MSLTLPAMSQQIQGFDTFGFVTPTCFTKLRNRGMQFAGIQLLTHDGAIDQLGLQSIQNALSGPFQKVSVMLYPCVPCGGPAFQVQRAYNALRTYLIANQIDRVWLMVTPDRWTDDFDINRNFFATFAATAQSLLPSMSGIASDPQSWRNAFGVPFYDFSSKFNLMFGNRMDTSSSLSTYSQAQFGGWQQSNVTQKRNLATFKDNSACSPGTVSYNINWRNSL